MNVKILHNPRCSKSRATLALLRERGIEPEIIDYRTDPPSVAELDRIARALGVEPRAMMRRGEAEWKTLGLNDPELDRAALLAAMAAHPLLIERPIVLAGARAAIGRPPEAVLEIL